MHRILPRPAPIEAYGNGGFLLRRHVASRFAAVPSRRHLGLAGQRSGGTERGGARSRCTRVLAALDVLLIGTGQELAVLPQALRARFRDVSLSVDTMATGAAVRTYNILLAENRRVGAGLIAV